MPLRGVALLAAVAVLAAGAAAATSPSFDCAKVAAGSVEDAICKDEALAALDRELNAVVTAAASRTKNPHQPKLKAEQAAWLATRVECAKAQEPSCLQERYRRRIAYLESRYRLTPPRGPIRYVCDGRAGNEVAVTFFATDPPTAVAQYRDSDSVLFAEPVGDGLLFRGPNETFSSESGEATVRWGADAPEMKCVMQP